MVLKNLKNTIKNAKKSKLYSEKLKNFSDDLSSIEDLQKLPFTTKKDLREAYPFNSLCVDKNRIIEVHTTSGTTGKPTLSFFTYNDIKSGSNAIAKSWKNFGINENSRVQFIMSYGLFSGAMLNTYAIQSIGAFVLPSGIQSTSKQLELMKDFEIDTLVATPGYLLYLYDYMNENKISRKSLKIKKAIAAGEVYSDKTKDEIEKKLNIKVYDHYGLCEVNTGIAYECNEKSGLHIIDDYVIPEIIDPKTEKNLKDGEYGELVLTSLKKEASPIIRYRTGDLTRIMPGVCKCGDKSIRIDRIKTRVDDLIFIKGIKINPHELKELILFDFYERLNGADIRILIKKNRVDYTPKILLSVKDFDKNKTILEIKKKIKEITGVNFEVENVDLFFF